MFKDTGVQGLTGAQRSAMLPAMDFWQWSRVGLGVSLL
jgi:hypothetical protein